MAASPWIDVWKTRPANEQTVWIRQTWHTPVQAVFFASTESTNAFFALADETFTKLEWNQIDQWHLV